jgi:hypothetical protein
LLQHEFASSGVANARNMEFLAKFYAAAVGTGDSGACVAERLDTASFSTVNSRHSAIGLPAIISVSIDPDASVGPQPTV